MDRPYTVLGLDPGADLDTVRSAYRSLLKEHHPDQGGSTEAFLRIKRAYEAIQERSGGGSEQSTSATAQTKTATDGGATMRDQNANWRLSGDERVTEHSDATPMSCCAGIGLGLQGEYATLTLVSLVEEAPLDGIAWNTEDDQPKRRVAYLTVENTSDRPFRWRGTQSTTFVGTDGEKYDPSRRFRPSDTLLPDDWRGSDVELDPGETMRTVVICERLPPSVGVGRISYTQTLFGGDGEPGVTDRERFAFAIGAGTRPQLSRRPF